METIISGNLKRLRRVKELSQRELARRSGVAQSAISRIEEGHLVPRISTIQKLAKALDQKPGALVKGAIERKEDKPRWVTDTERTLSEIENLRSLVEVIRRQRDKALDGWDESIDLVKRLNSDMAKFAAMFFVLGLMSGALTLMLLVGLFS